ncbi:MAG: methionine biosynthesis protein MetW [Rhizobiales bacterium]|nr:methionine biosynthesis protein MetW [Hyphomicrobiales bacterium]
MSKYQTRADLQILVEMIKPNSRVLDIGCGDGELLKLLTHNKNIDARGVELDQANVNRCVAEGLSVMQGNADTDLVNYPDEAFDYVILSKTIQATHRPDLVIEQMLRIGKHAIVSFHNFGHWRVIKSLAFKSQMPVTKKLTYSWYETPNIHFCTIKDLANLCESLNIEVTQKVILNQFGQKSHVSNWPTLVNLFGDQAIFLLKKK